MRKRSHVAITFATLLIAAPASAAPSAAEKETARSLLREADQRAREKDEVRALAAYRAADDIMNAPTTGIEVARSLERMGQLLEAREKYLAVKASAKKPDEPAVMDKARRAAEDAERALLARIPTLQVRPAGVDDPRSVRVQIDDVTLPAIAALLPRRVNPGTHVLVVSAQGFRDERVEVAVGEGQQQQVNVTLQPAARPEDTPSQVVMPAPIAAAASPGPLTKTDAEARGAGRSPVVYVALAAGAVGVGVGAVTGVMAFARTSAAKDNCTGNVCTPAAQGDIDASKALGVASTVAFGVGLAGLGLGTVLFFTSKPGAHGSAASPAWSFAMGPGAAHLRGTFR